MEGGGGQFEKVLGKKNLWVVVDLVGMKIREGRKVQNGSGPGLARPFPVMTQENWPSSGERCTVPGTLP